ncbi:MAG TPA: TonB-dependent receptor [Vicinamibacterales bacterium]|nr:TonB-dependent receptor [Vicinamibacterales bacterium]
MKNAVLTLLTALSILIPAGPSLAQPVRGTLQGLVVDTSGGVVAGAQVVVTSDATGAQLSVRTDDRGWFVVTPIDPGAHRLEVTHTGFRKHLQPFTLQVNQRLRVDVQLQAGQITETVTVSAPVTVDRTATSFSSRFDPDRIANLPLDGRNFLELALLTAGAVPAAQGSAGSVRGDFAFNVNGAREDANSFLLDGAYNFDPKLNTVAVRPPVDAIREFEVIASTPDATFGKSAGAQVNVITRSGGNRLSATGYEFWRTAAFNARNFFAPENEPAPEYRRHQYGGSLGGPVKKDRLFFFADFEGTRLAEGITRVTNVPTLEERDGNFSSSAFTPPRIPGFGIPFPGNRIPELNPIGHAIALLYPHPNRDAPFANFVSSAELTDDVDQFDTRVDFRGDRLMLTSRYSFSDRRFFEPFAGPGFSAVPGFGNDVPRRAQSFVVSATSQAGRRWLNEARVAFTRVAAGVQQEGQGESLNRQVGLPELSANPRDWGLSLINVAGYSSLGHEYNNPQDSQTNHWQISDTLSWTTGRHQVRFGGEVRLLRQQAFRDVQARGLLSFTSQAFTGNALADLLLGLPTATVGATLDNPQDLRASSYAAFVQDSFEVSPTLTVSAGMRYELNVPPVDAEDRVNLYDPATGSLVPVGQGGMPRAGYEADRNNFAPRLGLAWTARPSTVVRGGYGISYDQAALAPNEFLYFNSPYFDLNTYFTLPGLYTLTLFDPFPAQFPLPLPKSATAVQRDLRTGFLHHWNASVQRRVGQRTTVEVGYVGSLGRNLVAARDINQPFPSDVQFNPRPNPRFADITMIESRARSRFNALELRLDQQLNAGVSGTVSYTFGKSMDDASAFFASAGDANFPMDSNNPEAEWARSNFDVRHRLTFAGLWQIPVGPDRRWLRTGFGATCFGNWDLYAVVAMQTARPFTVALHPDIDNSGTGRASLGFGANDRPNQVGDPSVPDPRPEAWFDTSAFVLPQGGTFGNVGRNTLDGPGFKNVNVALTRKVALTRGALQLRLEVFNLFNWTNFDQPDNFMFSSTFGQILSAGAPRRFQLGIKYLY